MFDFWREILCTFFSPQYFSIQFLEALGLFATVDIYFPRQRGIEHARDGAPVCYIYTATNNS